LMYLLAKLVGIRVMNLASILKSDGAEKRYNLWKSPLN
jgi:hypothetical protein